MTKSRSTLLDMIIRFSVRGVPNGDFGSLLLLSLSNGQSRRLDAWRWCVEMIDMILDKGLERRGSLFVLV